MAEDMNVMAELISVPAMEVLNRVRLEDKVNDLHNQMVEIFERCNAIYSHLFNCNVANEHEKRPEPNCIDEKLSDIVVDAALTIRVLSEIMERL